VLLLGSGIGIGGGGGGVSCGVKLLLGGSGIGGGGDGGVSCGDVGDLSKLRGELFERPGGGGCAVVCWYK
jgi:hypothetical protein